MFGSPYLDMRTHISTDIEGLKVRRERRQVPLSRSTPHLSSRLTRMALSPSLCAVSFGWLLVLTSAATAVGQNGAVVGAYVREQSDSIMVLADEEGRTNTAATTNLQTSCDLRVGIDGEFEFTYVKIEVGYAGAHGNFVPRGSEPACGSLVGGRFVFLDDRDTQKLTAEWVAPEGLGTPTSLLTCRFNSSSGAPVAGDFSVWVTEAVTTQGESVAHELSWRWSRVCGSCGSPGCACPDQDPLASQCAYILRAAVGIASCHNCVCDLNGSGSISVLDALICLHQAVGQDVALACPACLVP